MRLWKWGNWLLVLWTAVQFGNSSRSTCFVASLPSTPADREQGGEMEVRLGLRQLDEAEEESTDDGGSHRRLRIFPRHVVPQVRQIHQRNALWMAVNFREIALLPGDRLELKDATNATRIRVTASNESIAKNAWRRPLFWDHPFLFPGNRVTIEYWPSLRTLTLPIIRPQLDNPVAILDSYTYMFRSRWNLANETAPVPAPTTSESIVGGRNEMKPATCYKSTNPKMYASSRSVARLIIRREREDPPRQSLSLGATRSQDAGGETIEAPEENTWTFCTGWILGQGNHLITNYHCFFELLRRGNKQFPWVQRAVMSGSASSGSRGDNTGSGGVATCRHTERCESVNDGKQCEAFTEVNFMAESKTCNASGRLVGGRSGEIVASRVRVLVANADLDYCLLRVQVANSTALSTRFGSLQLRAAGPRDREEIYIPQHPNGGTKLIASTKFGEPAYIRVIDPGKEQPSAAVTSDNVSVWYNADTKPGSSGSPVLSRRDNAVIALHHAGHGTPRPSFPFPDSHNQSASRVEEEFNVGIRSDAIVADLEAREMLPPCATVEAPC